MKRLLLLLLLYMGLSPLYGQDAPDGKRLSQRLNIGLKAGFASSMVFTDRFTIGDYAIEQQQNNFKLGYFFSIFNRFNLRGHHVIQPEFNYTVIRGSLAVPRTEELQDVIAGNLLIRNEITSIDFMPLYGYKFIDQDIYGMALFIGPKVGWIWKNQSHIDFTGFYQQSLSYEMHPLQVGIVSGLAVNLGKLFFDFRYDIGISHLLKRINFDAAQTPEPYRSQTIEIQRRRDILSFSFGIML